MKVSDIDITDNSELFIKAAKEQIILGLTACGLAAEGFAKQNITQNKSVDTGQLRNSITNKVVDNEQAVYIGSNVHYAPYVELGTGIYYEEGGRQTPWIYTDREGNTHLTRGQRAKPYLKPAIADHSNEYKTLLLDNLKS